MSGRRFRLGRKSMRDTLIDNKRALDFMADMSGKPRMHIDIPPPPKKRAPAGSNGAVLEKHVLAAILDMLRAHPRVAEARRQQSGVFQDGDRMIRVGHRGLLDIVGFLKGGRYFEIEAKRPGRGRLSFDQEARIHKLQAAGAIAGVAESVEDALSIIEERI